jgi:hypothetical protein
MRDVDRLQKKILDTVVSLARYEIDVWQKVGPGVQAALIESVERMPASERQKDRELITAVCETVLSPEMEGSVWNANSVTLRTGSVPPSQVAPIRESAISILFDLFKNSTSDAEKRKTIIALRHAGYTGGRTEASDDLLKLTLSNAKRIVDFFLENAAALSYELMETLEHEYLWDYRRARDIAKAPKREQCHAAATALVEAIRQLRDRFNSDESYIKFKVLVGYESVFPQQWGDDDRADDYQALETYRANEAQRYVGSISEKNQAEWFALIERVAAVESDDLATFPSFAKFLATLGRSKPIIAAQLLEVGSERVRGFLPAILGGLSESDNFQVYQAQVDHLLRQGKNLAALARHLRITKAQNPGLAGRTLARAIEANDVFAVMECLIIALEGGTHVPGKKDFFEPAIRFLNEKGEFRWLRAAWLLEAKDFFSALTEYEAKLFLPALMHAPKIDYQAERILVQIGKKYPGIVWECFFERLSFKKDDGEDRYEAVPYQLQELHKELSKDAELAVHFGRKMYERDSYLFRFNGGRLLSIAFPHFPSQFASELIKLAANGSESDVKFILAVMENYHGEEATHEVLKTIVARFPDDDSVRTAIMISLENTGVVMGEYGFVNALTGKLEMIRRWLEDPRPQVRTFAAKHIRSLELRIADERKRAEERKALRELDYDRPDAPLTE